MSFWMAVYSLWLREIVRFYRQPSRVVGAVGTALLFWLVLGTGIPMSNYRAYFLPGTIVMSVLFTCIFSNASVIEDRHAGFLQSVMVAPVSRAAIVMGKILGGATLSTLQGLILLPVALGVGATFEFIPFTGLVLSLFLLSFVLNAMGFWLAWKIESSPGFHTIMNMVLLPLWMASGAVFAGGAGWMKAFMKVNPFTYGVAGVRRGLFPTADLGDIPSLPLSLLALAGAGIFFYVLSSWAVEKTNEGKSK
ncbi:MAG TPA: ABC transporter permease [bacterium]|jgi:ABC-2 type transport system permease protein|nr:ABC transporter permease [bacterium]